MAEGVGNTPGQQTVDFSLLVKRTAEDAYTSLKELAGIAPEQSDSERKLSLLKCAFRTRQRLLRVLALSKWSRQIPLVERCQQLAGTVSNHDTSFTQAADFLFFLHEGLQQARAPIYDIPTAAEVLLTGLYKRLPKCIEELGMQPMLAGEEREEALLKLDTMLRSRLLDLSLPKEISDITVSDGRIILQVDGEFKVQLTAGYRGHLHLWRILHLELLVGESTGPTKFTDHQRFALGDDLERRMAASDDPFRILYSILHEFCSTLVMDTLFRQTGMLRQGRWKDAIRFEKISEASNANQGVGIGQGTVQGPGPPGDSDAELRAGTKSRSSPGLRIWYWLDCPKGISGVDPSSPCHLRIEPGPDQHIVCSHQPSVIDPATESEAEFSIDQCCIDVERLLLRAIGCNIHTRLLEVQRGLKGSSQLWRVDCDVVLRSSFSEDEDDKITPPSDQNNASGSSAEAGEEVLCVRAYGASFMALGISIRNGRFLLRSPSTLLANSVLADMEDALNQGSKDPVDVFLNLRSRSLLHVFASLGTNFNLKMYERGALALKFPPDGPKLGPDVLVLGFPNCGEVYFLSLHLDANFMPLFMLLEAQPRLHSGRSTLQSGSINIIRCMRINIETMLVTEDDASFSLLDEGRLEIERQSTTAGIVLKKVTGKEIAEFAGKKSEVSLLESRGFGRSLTAGPGHEGLQSDLTGEKFYRGSPAPHLSRTSNPLSPSFSPLPSPSGLQGMASSNPQYAGSNLVNPGPNGGFSPGNSTLANNSLLQSNHRVGRMGNGVMASPARSPLHRGVTSLKSPYQGDQDMLQSKSPLHGGESAASPIDLDDDDISKLIDSISSKTPGVPPGAPHSSPGGDLGSRQPRVGLTRSVPMVKSPAMNPRTPQTKSSPLQSLTSGRVTAQASNVLARLGSPRKPIGSQGSELTSEWMELDQSSQAVQSPSLLLSSPAARPSITGVQGHGLARSTVSSEKRKRSGSELLFSLPSLQGVVTSGEKVKRRKIEHESSQSLVGQSAPEVNSVRTLPVLDSFVGQPYSSIVAAANQGKAPMGSYTAVLLQVVRRCWLCIKHARLTCQMGALNIPYVEEVGLRRPSTNLRFRLPSKDANRDAKKYDSAGWQQICLCLGKPGSDGWEVEVEDTHFKALWELQTQKTSSTWGCGVQFATLPEEDSHFSCTQKGLVLRYPAVEDDSVKKLVADLERLWCARMFAVGIRKLLEEKVEDKGDGSQEKGEGEQEKGSRSHGRGRFSIGERSEGGEKKWEVMRRTFRVEAVGLTSIWFTYVGSLPGVTARFVVEWEVGNSGCTVHVSPEQLWPHTKYLEDYINGGEVELLLDSIRVSVGPLQALAAAIRPARMLGPATSAVTSSGPVQGGTSQGMASKPTAAGLLLSQVSSPISSSASTTSVLSQGRLPNGSTSVLGMVSAGVSIQGSQTGGLASGPGRPIIPGLVPSSLLPTDVSVLLRTPYWIRIVYRRQFAMDMRCFAGDQVWLQPAPPPRSGGSAAGGSLPCPQFRPFVMEHVAAGLSSVETASGAGPPATVSGNVGTERREFGPIVPSGWGGGANSTAPAMRSNTGSMIGSRLVNNTMALVSRGGNMQVGHPNSSGMQMTTGRNFSNGPSVALRSDYTAFFGLGDDGGYGGAWVPLPALKKVLRGTLRYLGVLWLFAQFPSILRDVLGSLLKENEGALLNHDPEQPALRFYIGNCVFAVSMHRQQLYLQAINVKKFQQQQGGDELSQPEMAEISEFFAKRVASEPYDASRLASFVTMLTLPIPILREFLKLLAWEKEMQKAAASQGQGGDGTQTSRPKLELCLENRVGSAFFQGTQEEVVPPGASSQAKSSIHHMRAQSIVEFTLTLYLDGQQLPPINVAGGAGWLPQSVAVRLRYQFSEPPRLSVVNVEGSHGGRACWVRQEDWEHSKLLITNAVDHYVPGNDQGLGRLQPVAELVQRTVQQAVLSLRKAGFNSPSPMASPYAS